MTRYYPGVNEVRSRVMEMTDAELLEQIDALYGRDNLKYGATHEEILAETLRQVEEDWTDHGQGGR